jgi:hypothetical protein
MSEMNEFMKSMIYPVPPLPVEKPDPSVQGYCVIEEWVTEMTIDFEFHEWAETRAAAEHTIGYEQDVNDQYHNAFSSSCGSEGCVKNCPALHSVRPRELWPIGFTQAIRAGLIAEPENPPTFDEWMDRNLGRSKPDDQNSR